MTGSITKSSWLKTLASLSKGFRARLNRFFKYSSKTPHTGLSLCNTCRLSKISCMAHRILFWLKQVLKSELKQVRPQISLPDRFDIDVLFEHNQKFVVGELKNKIKPIRCFESLFKKVRHIRRALSLFNPTIQVAVFIRSGITSACKKQLEQQNVLVFARTID